MTAERLYRLGRTAVMVGLVCWLLNPGSLATIVTGTIALTLLLKSEARR